jgi:hypothetical protein
MNALELSIQFIPLEHVQQSFAVIRCQWKQSIKRQSMSKDITGLEPQILNLGDSQSIPFM